MCYDHISTNWKIDPEITGDLNRELLRQLRADRFAARKLQREPNTKEKTSKLKGSEGDPNKR